MEQIQKLREYLARTKGTRYPFEGHPLAVQNDYMKNLYLKHLSMILRAGNAVSEEQTLFLQRLITGCGGEYDLETYMRQGQEVTPESLEELLSALTPDGLRDCFLLDALLLTHLGPSDGERDELLAALCEAARLKLPELEQLADLCGKILRLELCACIETEFRNFRRIQPELWKPYFLDAADAVTPEWKNTDDFLIAAAMKLTPLDVTTAIPVENFTFAVSDVTYQDAEFVIFRKNKTVCFYNLEIRMNVHLRFAAVEKVVFENCTFVGDGEREARNSSSLWFFGCGRIAFKQCSFRNFGGRVIHVLDCHDISVQNCEFTDCIVKYNSSSYGWRELGGVIYTNDTETPLHLLTTRFTSCGGCNATTNFFSSSIISNCTMTVHSCIFENCWHVCKSISGRSKDPESPNRCLFSHIREESSNTLTNSAELGPH